LHETNGPLNQDRHFQDGLISQFVKQLRRKRLTLLRSEQNEAWNVGISGTPNVNVSNPASAPLLSVNVNDPGRIPYQSTISGNCDINRRVRRPFFTGPNGASPGDQHVTGYVSFNVAPQSPPTAFLGGTDPPGRVSF
jgi:hypothetical protein